ncbi:MAG: hypothetical protein PHT33_12900 [bacterium]|nr:hypothetical protein [bacterium]
MKFLAHSQATGLTENSPLRFFFGSCSSANVPSSFGAGLVGAVFFAMSLLPQVIFLVDLKVESATCLGKEIAKKSPGSLMPRGFGSSLSKLCCQTRDDTDWIIVLQPGELKTLRLVGEKHGWSMVDETLMETLGETGFEDEAEEENGSY